MIKLGKILSEIKIIKNITPEIVIKKVEELGKKEEYISAELNEIIVKYIFYSGSRLSWPQWVYKLSKQNLINFYNELDKFKK